LKRLSVLVAQSTGKPESYVAVCITDKASMIFGGSDAPLALGCLYSLGGINMANNGKIQSGVTDVLEKYGVTENRCGGMILHFVMKLVRFARFRSTFFDAISSN